MMGASGQPARACPAGFTVRQVDDDSVIPVPGLTRRALCQSRGSGSQAGGSDSPEPERPRRGRGRPGRTVTADTEADRRAEARAYHGASRLTVLSSVGPARASSCDSDPGPGARGRRAGKPAGRHGVNWQPRTAWQC